MVGLVRQQRSAVAAGRDDCGGWKRIELLRIPFACVIARPEAIGDHFVVVLVIVSSGRGVVIGRMAADVDQVVISFHLRRDQGGVNAIGDERLVGAIAVVFQVLARLVRAVLEIEGADARGLVHRVRAADSEVVVDHGADLCGRLNQPGNDQLSCQM